MSSRSLITRDLETQGSPQSTDGTVTLRARPLSGASRSDAEMPLPAFWPCLPARASGSLCQFLFVSAVVVVVFVWHRISLYDTLVAVLEPLDISAKPV